MGALLLAVTFIAYWPALSGGLLWDDAAHITKPSLRSLDGLQQIWINPHSTQQYYPLSHSAFWVMWWPFGENTLGYHVVNVVLHAINAVLVWLVLRRLRIDPRAAVLAAFVFALHPVNVESVAWITELKNTLSMLFYLLAMLTYPPFAFEDSAQRSAPRWLASFLFFALAVLTKSFTASWPAAMLVIIWWQRGRISLRRDVLPLLPFFVAGVAMGLFTMWAERDIWGAEGESFSLTAPQRFIIAGRAVWSYLGTLVWPVNLMFFYPRWDVDPASILPWLWPFSAVFVLIALWLWSHTIGRGPLAATLLFGGTLLPALGFFNLYWHLYTFVCDHMLYLAGIPAIALLCAVLVRAIDRAPTIARLLVPAVALALGVLTWQRCHAFTDSITLWQDTIRRNPQCWMAFNNLGIDYMRQNRATDAAVAFRQAVSIKPNHAPAHANLARAYLASGQPTLAIEACDAALRVRPQFIEPYLHMAEACAQLGRFAECAQASRAALSLNPNVAIAHNWLGLALQNLGDERAAADAFNRALEIEPDNPDFFNNFAWLLATAADPTVADGPKAVDLAERAFKLQPRPETLGALAAAYARAGQFDLAVATAKRAIEAAEQAGKADLAQSTRHRLEHYEAGKPWIEPLTNGR